VNHKTTNGERLQVYISICIYISIYISIRNTSEKHARTIRERSRSHAVSEQQQDDTKPKDGAVFVQHDGTQWRLVTYRHDLGFVYDDLHQINPEYWPEITEKI